MIDLKKYFDHNATTPLCASAREAWLEMADRHWENPSSLYREAGQARRLLEDLREVLAGALEADEAERLVFNSGATEGNNAVIQHWAEESPPQAKVVLSAVEHPSLRAAADRHFGSARLIEVPVLPETGELDFEAFQQVLSEEKSLAGVSVMAANNETGTLQPIEEVLNLCRERTVPYHCDAAQWFGKRDATGFAGFSFVTGSAHKFGGPKGTGFLLLPEDWETSDFTGLAGGPQENQRRGGTEDLPGIAAMIAALSSEEWNRPLCAEARDRFEKKLSATGSFRFIGNQGPRLANTSMILLPWEKNLKWLTRLSAQGFGVSTGSACSAGKGNPSRVMEAMGLSFDEMGRVLRISGGPGQGVSEWTALADAIIEIAGELEGTTSR